MASLTDYSRNKFLDVWRGQVLTPPGNWYVGLFVVVPTDAGGGTEPTGGGYARVPLAANLAAWNATQGGAGSVSSGTSGLVSNVAVIQFATCTVEWGDLAGAGLFDALTGGNLWMFDEFRDSQGNPNPFFVTVGMRPVFDQQEFSFSFPTHDPQ